MFRALPRDPSTWSVDLKSKFTGEEKEKKLSSHLTIGRMSYCQDLSGIKNFNIFLCMFKNSVSPYSDMLVIVDSMETFDGRGSPVKPPWRL